MAIKFESSMKQGMLQTVRVDRDDLPTLLPKGCRCEIMGVHPKQLSMGDVVATVDGKFRRFWSSDGKTLWLTDQSGFRHESSAVKDGVVRKVIINPGPIRNLVWMMGASAGRLRRK